MPQIVKQSLELNEAGTIGEQKRIALARLEPALRLAARAVAEGRLEGIDRLIKVVDRMDRIGASPGVSTAEDYAGAHERLMAKINGVAARMLPQPEPDLEQSESDLESSQDVENA